MKRTHRLVSAAILWFSAVLSGCYGERSLGMTIPPGDGPGGAGGVSPAPVGTGGVAGTSPAPAGADGGGGVSPVTVIPGMRDSGMPMPHPTNPAACNLI